MHLMTIIEVPPCLAERHALPLIRMLSGCFTVSSWMLYRLFGVRRGDVENQALLGINPADLTLYQVTRLASFMRYESRASVRLRKAVKRLMAAIGQELVAKSWWLRACG